MESIDAVSIDAVRMILKQEGIAVRRLNQTLSSLETTQDAIDNARLTVKEALSILDGYERPETHAELSAFIDEDWGLTEEDEDKYYSVLLDIAKCASYAERDARHLAETLLNLIEASRTLSFRDY